MINHRSGYGGSFYSNNKQLIPIFMGLDSILINLLLLGFYTRGLYVSAFRRYHNNDIAEKLVNSNLVNDRIYELMLEATRYMLYYLAV